MRQAAKSGTEAETQKAKINVPLVGADAPTRFVWKENTDRTAQEAKLRKCGFQAVDPRGPRHNLCTFDATPPSGASATQVTLFRANVSDGQVHCRKHGNTVTEIGGLHHLRGFTVPVEQATYDENLRQWTRHTICTLFLPPVKQRSACDLTDVICKAQDRRPERQHLVLMQKRRRGQPTSAKALKDREPRASDSCVTAQAQGKDSQQHSTSEERMRHRTPPEVRRRRVRLSKLCEAEPRTICTERH